MEDRLPANFWSDSEEEEEKAPSSARVLLHHNHATHSRQYQHDYYHDFYRSVSPAAVHPALLPHLLDPPPPLLLHPEEPRSGWTSTSSGGRPSISFDNVRRSFSYTEQIWTPGTSSTLASPVQVGVDPNRAHSSSNEYDYVEEPDQEEDVSRGEHASSVCPVADCARLFRWVFQKFHNSASFFDFSPPLPTQPQQGILEIIFWMKLKKKVYWLRTFSGSANLSRLLIGVELHLSR